MPVKEKVRNKKPAGATKVKAGGKRKGGKITPLKQCADEPQAQFQDFVAKVRKQHNDVIKAIKGKNLKSPQALKPKTIKEIFFLFGQRDAVISFFRVNCKLIGTLREDCAVAKQIANFTIQATNVGFGGTFPHKAALASHKRGFMFSMNQLKGLKALGFKAPNKQVSSAVLQKCINKGKNASKK